jgi:hypothetical protein
MVADTSLDGPITDVQQVAPLVVAFVDRALGRVDEIREIVGAMGVTGQ